MSRAIDELGAMMSRRPKSATALRAIHALGTTMIVLALAGVTTEASERGPTPAEASPYADAGGSPASVSLSMDEPTYRAWLPYLPTGIATRPIGVRATRMSAAQPFTAVVLADGRTVVEASTEGLAVWDVANRRRELINAEEHEPPLAAIVDLAVTPDGTMWLAHGGGQASIGVVGGLTLGSPGAGWRHVGAENGLPSAVIGALAVAPDGRLLAGTDIGISRLEVDGTWSTLRLDALYGPVRDEHPVIQSMVIAADGTLWASTIGAVVHVSLDDWTYVVVDVMPPMLGRLSVSNIVARPDGGVALVDGDGVWQIAPDAEPSGTNGRSFVDFPTEGGSSGRWSVAFDASGTLWALADDGATIAWLGSDGNWVARATDEVFDLGDDRPSTLTVDAQGQVWFVGGGGLHVRAVDGTWRSVLASDPLARVRPRMLAVRPGGGILAELPRPAPVAGAALAGAVLMCSSGVAHETSRAAPGTRATIAASGDGALWASTEYGLLRWTEAAGWLEASHSTDARMFQDLAWDDVTGQLWGMRNGELVTVTPLRE